MSAINWEPRLLECIEQFTTCQNKQECLELIGTIAAMEAVHGRNDASDHALSTLLVLKEYYTANPDAQKPYRTIEEKHGKGVFHADR